VPLRSLVALPYGASPGFSRSGWRAASIAVAALLALAVIATGIPVVHGHAGAAPGVYDEQCQLERLATGYVGLTIEPAGDALPLLPAIGPTPPPNAQARPTLLRYSPGSRAPPTTC
jgi:hypothetical protein